MTTQRISLERVRITRVGIGFVFVTVLVGFAAVNTGNNALYMVEAMLLALLAVSGLSSRGNLRGLELEVEAPGEVYANQPFGLRYRLTSRSRLSVKRWLTVSAGKSGGTELVPCIGRQASHGGRLDLMIRRRGLRRIRNLRVSSVFPLGLFFKVMRYRVGLEILVYPEIFPVSTEPVRRVGDGGEDSIRKIGWGHDLLSLRKFRSGDDPRGIHWKQTARTGMPIYMERQTDEGRRLSILLDNGVGVLGTETERIRFERLVSEAASAAVHHLKAGFEVELVTREGTVPFGRGRNQQNRVLEQLALIESCAPVPSPLRSSDAAAPRLRFGFELPQRATA